MFVCLFVSLFIVCVRVFFVGRFVVSVYLLVCTAKTSSPDRDSRDTLIVIHCGAKQSVIIRLFVFCSITNSKRMQHNCNERWKGHQLVESQLPKLQLPEAWVPKMVTTKIVTTRIVTPKISTSRITTVQIVTGFWAVAVFRMTAWICLSSWKKIGQFFGQLHFDQLTFFGNIAAKNIPVVWSLHRASDTF